ncbi:hypothetical protein ACFLQP_01245 [Acidobacteriota bacterium]
MGLFKKTIKGEKPYESSSQDGKIMLSKMVSKQAKSVGGKVGSYKCDIDGTTFIITNIQVYLVTPKISDYVIDIGGYCSKCQKYICQKHLRFERGDTQYSWILVHDSCGTRI